MNSTSTNGTRKSFIASSQASAFSPAFAGLGGVCGRLKLSPARTSEAIPEVRKAQLFPWLSATPASGVPSAWPGMVTAAQKGSEHLRAVCRTPLQLVLLLGLPLCGITVVIARPHTRSGIAGHALAVVIGEQRAHGSGCANTTQRSLAE